jgi:hypothetical protein
VRLGPASLPGPLLLAVSPRLPANMRREQFCLADFQVLHRLYDGHASTICKARDRVSGSIVALKLYRMHKLNDISSHQVAREVLLWLLRAQDLGVHTAAGSVCVCVPHHCQRTGASQCCAPSALPPGAAAHCAGP